MANSIMLIQNIYLIIYFLKYNIRLKSFNRSIKYPNKKIITQIYFYCITQRINYIKSKNLMMSKMKTCKSMINNK